MQCLPTVSEQAWAGVLEPGAGEGWSAVLLEVRLPDVLLPVHPGLGWSD